MMHGLVPASDRAPLAFLSDLFAQLFSDGARIDAERYCKYDGVLGLLLLAGAVVTRSSGPPDPLGAGGFALVVASGATLVLGLVVSALRPRWVPALLALHGALVLALTLGLAVACAFWALGPSETRAFRYLPGLIVVGTTYGAALWADHGPARARPRAWRFAGFVAGLVLEVAVGVMVVAVLVRG